MTREDAIAIGWAAFFIVATILAGLACAVLSHWLCDVFARAGAVELPAQFLAYLVTACLLVFVVFTAGVRVTEKSWWFRP